jgi:hypothetical protein
METANKIKNFRAEIYSAILAESKEALRGLYFMAAPAMRTVPCSPEWWALPKYARAAAREVAEQVDKNFALAMEGKEWRWNPAPDTIINNETFEGCCLAAALERA